MTDIAVGGMRLRDGVLAWQEGSASTNNRALKADTWRGAVALSAPSTATLIGDGSGSLVYGQQGKVYRSNAASDLSTLRVDVARDRVLVFAGRWYSASGRRCTGWG